MVLDYGDLPPSVNPSARQRPVLPLESTGPCQRRSTSFVLSSRRVSVVLGMRAALASLAATTTAAAATNRRHRSRHHRRRRRRRAHLCWLAALIDSRRASRERRATRASTQARARENHLSRERERENARRRASPRGAAQRRGTPAADALAFERTQRPGV